MNEQEVINYWGSGEYIEGFGGYGRYYSDRHVMISFSNDKENSMYGKVSSIYFSNPQYSIFSVKIGDKKNEGINKLKSNRFKPVNYADDTFERGEFSISLRGKNDINYIQILYNDKDLRDRNY
ncbi:hypothetical protein ACFO9Q_04895 [Paenibacillus sp. GCM10023252]|uniref:hypothetical protein n=1 Tax=Paenibacillus sp. GCM10023252 TaxID=3252649 RepID=UPI00361BDBF6